MFKSDFLEFFSRVHPVTPLLLYAPLVVYMLYLAFWRAGLSLPAVAALFLCGLVIWSLFEYAIHRHLFHYEPRSRLGKQLHFIVHGVHHDYPNDAKRLVMPPVVSIPLAIAFFGLFFSMLGRFAPPVSAGFASGYICYDTVHYAIHHFPMKGGVWRRLKQYHLRHHFHDDQAGYGVSSPLWDYVFGTKPK
jgi:sterol desaturase/sphingolipid hydroxylase (fatty acid hydroxylase superfamily)